jgi:3alpha(or 20beta)-hydroxysteroid dehydrogenase
MARLRGKVALVTGGAAGIGRGIVEAFLAESAQVVLTDINATAGKQTALDTGATFILHDVADTETWVSVMASIMEAHGRLDIVVNNAGVISNQSIEEVDMDTWNRVVGTNMTGVMLGCKHAVEEMRRNPEGSSGSIINIGSTTSFLGLSNDLPYTATKTALLGITKSVATWCAREGLNIRCNSLHPGAIYTDILKSHVDEDPAMFDVFSRMAPLGRMGTVEEVAKLAVFLASDDASFSTGGQFVADGGIGSAHPSM